MYFLVGIKNNEKYFWCYDYDTEHKARGAIYTRKQVRERANDFDEIIVCERREGLFGKPSLPHWRTKEETLNCLYEKYLKKKELCANDPWYHQGEVFEKCANTVITQRYIKYLFVKNNF
jgi:hypothetical protein